jgi:hypothetical protein
MMTQLLCAANQAIIHLLSQDEMKVKVYNPGGISHDFALPPQMPCCRRHAAAAATVTFVFIVVIVAAIVAISVAITAAVFS